MASNESQRRNFFSLRVPANMHHLPASLPTNQLEQVVRGVIPGAGANPEYHPNPYLPHLYNRQASLNGHLDYRGGNLGEGDLHAQLQEVISDESSITNGLLEVPTHGHTHGHTHGDTQTQLFPGDGKVVFRALAFGLILFLRLMADHILGVLVFLAFSVVFYYSDLKMIEIVHITSLRERSSHGRVTLTSLLLVLFLSANIIGIYFMLSDQELWRILYYVLPKTWHGDIFDLFWVTVITDHLIKFVAIIFKAVASLIPQFFLPQKRKGKVYMFIEVVIQLYRTSLPIVPWIHFLYDQTRSVFASLLVTAYVILKCWSFYLEGVKVYKAVKVLTTDMKFGVTPTTEEIKARGESCPICQDDFQDPVMLSCKHIFCENCVSVWFDREKTCPMCRAQIQADSPVWQDGSTSVHLQWY